METKTLSQLADWLEENSLKISSREEYLDVQKVYELLDELAILRQPVQNYFEMTEKNYYENESDHRLTLQHKNQVLRQLQDRILVNHVDGSFIKSEINFDYNHENPYREGTYNVQTDLHLIEYALEVIGAVVANTIKSDVRNNLSPDAVLSIALAAQAVAQWQK
ncbi:hypothetical protein MOO45_07420 [Bombilactobacillus folatiphilus]|uniref:Uncharacterized protein n=1 Tax=Bombilactobacillus folatiphilus TaxID=2923362 RepID=A0ABY4P8H5_9LACO|nr:hypothetical protein [Bombilactobacillus folatiphilus]UQS82010.1 hypothetical protein MOO45_07420 [Bombilactobacillus folatiphilus]